MPDDRQTVLVTGANRGIGFEVCRQLARMDYRVLLTARDGRAAETASIRLQGEGLTVTSLQLDITDESSVRRAVEYVQARLGVLDVLINNAAIDYDSDQTVFELDLDRVEAAFRTNTIGTWRVTRAFLPLLRRSDHGRIVNVSSRAGTIDRMMGTSPAYSISKIALNALTLMMANTLEGSGILVNAVCPGWTATDMGGPGAAPIPRGAAGVVFAATLPEDGPSGRFFRHGEEIPW